MAKLNKEEYIEKFKDMWPEADNSVIAMSYAFYVRFASELEFSEESLKRSEESNIKPVIQYFD